MSFLVWSNGTIRKDKPSPLDEELAKHARTLPVPFRGEQDPAKLIAEFRARHEPVKQP